MIVVNLFVKTGSKFEKVDFFEDEKISVNSSIQNIADISKTFTDFSQTFTIPATKKNNNIFKNWFENSFEVQFSTAKKAPAYIELDTVSFRVGKIQLEKCNFKNNLPQNYSITFIGSLGNLKDKFAGLFLKDLTSTEFDEGHNGAIVRDKVGSTAVSGNVMYPLITSDKLWRYDSGAYPISNNAFPIYFTDLFPALRVKAIFKLISNQFGVNFTGTFLENNRFKAAYLLLKNAEYFKLKGNSDLITFDFKDSAFGYEFNLTTSTATAINYPELFISKSADLVITTLIAGLAFTIETYRNGILVLSQSFTTIIGSRIISVSPIGWGIIGDAYTFRIVAPIQFSFMPSLSLNTTYLAGEEEITNNMVIGRSLQQTTTIPVVAVRNFMPEIKIEDFFSGILKMFNLTCFSTDGVNFTIETIEDFYSLGTIRDLTQYVRTDNIDINRVVTFKKINFEYEKSDSLTNVNFLSSNGIGYGNLSYDTQNDGSEYNIKLPFENLNFANLKDKLQCGYLLKQDFKSYIPKPIILYDFNPLALTALTSAPFKFSTASSGNATNTFGSYKAFGQEFKQTDETLFSLNFNEQQSTINNIMVVNSLYATYYDNYIENIFNYKSRIIKVGMILPVSVLTVLKLNDRIIIRDKRYIINAFTTDLTKGEVTMDLLTDLRIL